MSDGVWKSPVFASPRCHGWAASLNATVGLKTDRIWPFRSDPFRSFFFFFCIICHVSPNWLPAPCQWSRWPPCLLLKFLPLVSLPAALVDCEHLAMILEQASDGVQRLCVPFLSGPYVDCVDLRLSGARGFVCSEGMTMTSRPDTQSVILLAYLFASIFFSPSL